jgi:hypothetical protein
VLGRVIRGLLFCWLGCVFGILGSCVFGILGSCVFGILGSCVFGLLRDRFLCCGFWL